eukprot:CAMPEP_0198645474 /NCGR_PEP_ID=MMETSP1467-20131203/1267_1 /TAXON_ID=1462469 /ORGANISM="unid. sp., Strain CCMP2135" /LENGTH=232 /DNA_ID=CAMNT_0044380965 /DNA_START=217 /DNA_END=913 /DNA_ORIENTATION=+
MTGGGGGSNNEGAYIKRTRKETWEGRLRSVGRRLEAVDAFFDVGDGLVDALDVEDVPALGFEEVADRQGDAREGGGGGAGGDGVGAVGVERGDDFVGQAAPRIARRVGQFAHDELARFAGAPRFPEPLRRGAAGRSACHVRENQPCSFAGSGSVLRRTMESFARRAFAPKSIFDTFSKPTATAAPDARAASPASSALVVIMAAAAAPAAASVRPPTTGNMKHVTPPSVAAPA